MNIYIILCVVTVWNKCNYNWCSVSLAWPDHFLPSAFSWWTQEGVWLRETSPVCDYTYVACSDVGQPGWLCVCVFRGVCLSVLVKGGYWIPNAIPHSVYLSCRSGTFE